MTDETSLIIGITIGVILVFILLIILIIFYYKRFFRKHDDSMIIHKDTRSISFINYDYHYNMTLLASPRRLAILELQQKQEEEEDESCTYDNPSFNSNELIQSRTVRF